MLTASKFALAAAIVLGTALSASAATKAQAARDNKAATSSSDVIPGYDKDGGHAAIPNPDR
jgi:hypothetical protein